MLLTKIIELNKFNSRNLKLSNLIYYLLTKSTFVNMNVVYFIKTINKQFDYRNELIRSCSLFS